MKVPLSWLNDYVDVSLTPEELADLLTFAGLEVEAMEYVGLPLPRERVYTEGLLEMHPDGYGFLRKADRSYQQHPTDIYVSAGLIRIYPRKKILRSQFWEMEQGIGDITLGIYH